MTEILDIVELTVNLPKDGLFAGMQGTVVELYADDACEVEFVNEQGETLQMLPLRFDQYIVVWRSKTGTWVPIVERIAALASRMPERASQELLDFARFLSVYRQPTAAEHQAAYATSSNLTTIKEPNSDPYRLIDNTTFTPPDP